MSRRTKHKPSLDEGVSRRSFIVKSTLAIGAITIIPRHVMGQGYTPPSDRVNLAVIGLGKQGNHLASLFLQHTEAQIVAGADVWDTKRSFFQSNLEKHYTRVRATQNYSGVKTYLDYREMLERQDIDGIVVATPDHWHAIQSIDAMKAGKDVFCEKPLTNTLHEGAQMVKAVNKYDRIFQTGSMQRSWEIFIKAKDLVRSGKLGNIEKVLVNVGDPAKPYDLSKEAMPEGIDWNLWCGPAPLLSYNHRIAPSEVTFFPDWRLFQETGGGILSDWGAHMFDIAQWALDMDHTGPITYIPPKDPTAKRGLKMYYDNGIEMRHEDFGRGWAVRFIGSKGSLDVSRSFLDTNPSSILFPEAIDNSKELFKDKGNHYQNWLTAIKNRDRKTICPVEIGHRTASICNIANIAYRLNRELKWNPKKERFKGDPEANKLRKIKQRTYLS